MNPLSTFIGIIVLSTSILLAEEPSPRSDIDGVAKGTSSSLPIIRPILPRFEYKVHVLDQGSSQETALNRLGSEGWELVTIVSHPDSRGASTEKAYMKRTLRKSTPEAAK